MPVNKKGSKRPYVAGKPQKRMEPTPALLDEIEELAGLGFTHSDMYDYYGMRHACWFDWLKEHPVISERIKRGRAIILKLYTSKLKELGEKGNYKAIAFYLTMRHRWDDNRKPCDDDIEKPLAKDLPMVSSITTDPVEASKVYQDIMTGNVKK